MHCLPISEQLKGKLSNKNPFFFKNVWTYAHRNGIIILDENRTEVGAMSRGTNQKFKFTYLMQVMLEKTDDEHSLTLNQILEELDKYGVTAERKSIYTDF